MAAVTSRKTKANKAATTTVKPNQVVKSRPPAQSRPDTSKPDKAQSNDRINCRISPAIKRKAEAAAQALGQSITAFTETALAEKAQSVLAEQERIVLSERDFARFVEIVNDITPPAPALVKAMQNYEKTRAAHPERGL